MTEPPSAMKSDFKKVKFLSSFHLLTLQLEMHLSGLELKLNNHDLGPCGFNFFNFLYMVFLCQFVWSGMERNLCFK